MKDGYFEICLSHPSQNGSRTPSHPHTGHSVADNVLAETHSQCRTGQLSASHPRERADPWLAGNTQKPCRRLENRKTWLSQVSKENVQKNVNLTFTWCSNLFWCWHIDRSLYFLWHHRNVPRWGRSPVHSCGCFWLWDYPTREASILIESPLFKVPILLSGWN